jgi:DNA-binding transcriptional LysR family regulator
LNAQTQYKLSAVDLELLLALARGGTLAAAGQRLGLDTSTVFRSLQRIERGLGQRLFERSRSGYLASELAQTLAGHAEQLHSQLQAARSAAQLLPEQLSGTLRISTTDSILHGLVAPALRQLSSLHPQLDYELHCGNELANLTRHDADLAIRATKKPPLHLIGKHLGPIRVALYASASEPLTSLQTLPPETRWIAPDDALPEHPSVLWRQRHYPKIVPTYRVNSILSVLELVALGLGVGVLPLFLGQGRRDLRQISPVLDECQTELWLLAHPQSRHLRRVATGYSYLAEHLRLT